MTRPMRVGDTAPERAFGPLTRATFVRYTAASGDLNPLHYDDEFARSVGYPSVFSHGMHQAALLSTFVTDWFGAEAIRGFRVRFKDQVWPGDTVTCAGVVEHVEPHVRAGVETQLVTVRLSAVRQDGRAVIDGSAIVELAVPPPA